VEEHSSLLEQIPTERRKVGTIFTVGDAEAVKAHSQPMILDPLAGHDDASRRIDRPDPRETLKALDLLDGAFVVNCSFNGSVLHLAMDGRHPSLRPRDR